MQNKENNELYSTSFVGFAEALVRDMNTLSSLIMMSWTSWRLVLHEKSSRPNDVTLSWDRDGAAAGDVMFMSSSSSSTDRRLSRMALSLSSSLSRSEVNMSTTWNVMVKKVSMSTNQNVKRSYRSTWEQLKCQGYTYRPLKSPKKSTKNPEQNERGLSKHSIFFAHSARR